MTARIVESIRSGLEEALAFAQGTADESQYVVHTPESIRSIPRRKRKPMSPLHPGEMLREDFLIPLGMTARMLAKEIKVPERRVVGIVKERRGLDGEICLRLARFFRMSPEFWMNLQKAYELEIAMEDWPRICREVSMRAGNRQIA
ncbi:MAG: HigA family addiction module antitoxin [Terracidiphilus sp.]